MLIRSTAGELVVALARRDCAALAPLLEQLQARHRRDGVPPPAALDELVIDARRLLTLASFADVGNVGSLSSTPGPESMVTVSEAVVMVSGVPARTLRHWLGTGRVPGARQTPERTWLIPLAAVLDLKENHHG